MDICEYILNKIIYFGIPNNITVCYNFVKTKQRKFHGFNFILLIIKMNQESLNKIQLNSVLERREKQSAYCGRSTKFFPWE